MTSTTPVLPLGRFAPIGLEELIGWAELLTRVDRKYVLTRGLAVDVLGACEERTRILEIDGCRAARYETVYFDTPDLLAYRMCVQQRRVRLKLRTRSYVDSGTTYLEAKTRRGDDTTVKERIEYEWADRDELTGPGHDYAADAFAALGLDATRADGLEPALVTRYRRSTLLAPDGDGRITVDSDLGWALPDGAELNLPHLVIVETKSSGRATAMDRELWRAGSRPVAVSKYATGLAALTPSLPRNRWARLLRGPFRPVPAPPREPGMQKAPD